MKISNQEKLGYSLGDFASVMYWTTFSMFLLYFYTDVFGISAAAAGTMFLVTRIWDTVNDPLMGIISDRTKTKWGKFRPFILWFAIPFVVIGVLTFSTPDFNDTGKMIYAYVTYSFMMMVYTALNIPYSALMGVMSPNSQARTELASFRFVAAFGGQMLVQAATLKLVEYFGGGENEQLGWQVTMIVYGVLALILFFITFISTRERVEPIQEDRSAFKSDLKDLISNGPWIILSLAGVFLITYVAIRNGSIVYYFKYVVGDQTINLFGNSRTYDQGELAATFMVVGSIANIIGVILTSFITKFLSKKQAFMSLMGITVFFTISFIWIPISELWLLFTLQALIGLAMGPLSPLLWSMYTDIADYSEWKYNRRATGLVMSASTMTQKLGWTIGGSMAGWLLAYYGFEANTDQSQESMQGISYMIGLLPAIAAVICVGFMSFYLLDAKMIERIEKELAERKSDKTKD